MANLEVEFNKFSDFKTNLISFLNRHPLMSFAKFTKKKQLNKIKNENNFTIKNSKLNKIYYPWRNNTKIFHWISIFDNIYTKDNIYFLRDQEATLLYDDDNNKNFYRHRHVIWISPIFIKLLQETEHIYIDCTYISTKEFYQLLIIMGYNQLIDIKIPCAYVLMNNKTEKSYNLILSEILNIITIENNVKLKLISITSDFEKGLINGIKNIFKEIRHVGCLFHLVKNIRINLLKIGLFNKHIKDITNFFLKDISSLPFKIDNNIKVIDDIFNMYYKEHAVKNFNNILDKFKNDIWKPFFENGSLNYIYINKTQLTN